MSNRDIIWVNGFSSKGEDNKATVVESLDEFCTIFGYPTNNAEMTAYRNVKSVLENNQTVLFSRIGYPAQ